jgi:toxin-antitoxin system PIN domain toxin
LTPDVNVLVAAYRRDHPHHAVALAWLGQAQAACAAGASTLVVLPMVVAGFLRLVTNPRVFVDPDSIDDAVGFVDALARSPGVEFPANGAEWPTFREKLLTIRLPGNGVTDVWIAAATQALAEHLVTFDRDFKRLLPARDLTVLPATD